MVIFQISRVSKKIYIQNTESTEFYKIGLLHKTIQLKIWVMYSLLPPLPFLCSWKHLIMGWENS